MYAPVDVPWLNDAMGELVRRCGPRRAATGTHGARAQAARNNLTFGTDIVPLPNGCGGRGCALVRRVCLF